MTNKTVFLNLGLTQLQYKVIFPSFVTFVHTILDTRKQSNSSEGGSEVLSTNTCSALTTSWNSCTSHVVSVIQWHLSTSEIPLSFDAL